MKLSTLAALVVLAPALTAAQPAAAPPADFQTELWASACMACHGTEGKAEGVALTIGGRQADELYGILLAYKTGQRQGTVMQKHLKGYSDEELRRIAQFFSRFK
jgi:cytochrome c553